MNTFQKDLNKIGVKISKTDELIESKKKELDNLITSKKELQKKQREIKKKIIDLKSKNLLELEIKKELNNLLPIPIEEMEDNSPAKMHHNDTLDSTLKEEYKNIPSWKWSSKMFNKKIEFGDILDTTGNRHYGCKFVGKNGLLENTTRGNLGYMSIDPEEGVVVPINISKYLTDTVSKYSNNKHIKKYLDGTILLYELPYHDVTVQKYNVKKGQMYEYGCRDEKYGFNTKKWYLEQIDIKTGERTRPKKIRKKRSPKKKKKSPKKKQ